jgi:hypothetical protein
MKTKFKWKESDSYGGGTNLELVEQSCGWKFVSFENEARMVIEDEGGASIFIHYCNPKTEFLPMLKEFIKLSEKKHGKDWSKRGG